MNNEQILEKNLILLEKINPQLVYQLAALEPSALEFCYTSQGELNLKRTYQGQVFYYHDDNQAMQEARDWFQGLLAPQLTVLYVYGIGLGYDYVAAKEWLAEKAERALIFLEEDLGVLYHLLQTSRGTELLQNPQVHLYYFSDLKTDKGLFNELSWTYASSPFVVSALRLYANVNSQGFLELHHLISHQVVQKKALVDEYLHYGIVFFRNFYSNLLELPSAYLGNGLFGQFQQIPAIICGAGPSLSKNCETLKTLTSRALIFAGGSALNALLAQGIEPHFGAGVDPNRGQYERISQTQSTIPFFYRNRLFHDALKAIRGPKLYLTGAGGYETANWFDEQLGLTGESLDEGHNVVNFCIEIAHAMGCHPIILVGVDLAFTNQQLYAEGVITQATFKQEEEKDFDNQPILKEDIQGQPIYTLWKWVTEADWITEFVQTHPSVTLINATEGGIGMEQVPNRPLKEVAETLLTPSLDLKAKIEQEMEKHALTHLKRASIVALMDELKKSLVHCIALFEALIGEMENLKVQIKAHHSSSLQTREGLLIEMQIEEEIAYQYVLDTFSVIYVRWHQREIQALQDQRQQWNEKERELKKVDMQIKRLKFLIDVAKVNEELIKRALNS